MKIQNTKIPYQVCWKIQNTILVRVPWHQQYRYFYISHHTGIPHTAFFKSISHFTQNVLTTKVLAIKTTSNPYCTLMTVVDLWGYGMFLLSSVNPIEKRLAGGWGLPLTFRVCKYFAVLISCLILSENVSKGKFSLHSFRDSYMTRSPSVIWSLSSMSAWANSCAQDPCHWI